MKYKEFDIIYQKVLDEIYEYWTPEMQKELSIHNYAWSTEIFDFKSYLQRSSIRFFKAYQTFADKGLDQKICDVGGFWGVFPLTLKELGFNVTMTESLQYYSESFNKLFKFIKTKDVNVVDFDPFQKKATNPDSFDVVTVMAVLEHYPHSLKYFMENTKSMVAPDGLLYLEVPNIAYWPKRIKHLLGGTPLMNVEVIYKSDIPFIGHHHEFTMGELKQLTELSKLEIVDEIYYNYSPQKSIARKIIWGIMENMINPILPDTCECIAIACKKKL